MSLPSSAFGDRFELGDVLAETPFERCFAAFDTVLRREVMLKVPAAGAHAGWSAPVRERLLREARALANVRHPNVTPIHWVETTPDGPLLVFDLPEGEPLAERLERGPLDVAETTAVGREIAGALAEVHRHGVVHRAVGPSSIRLCANGRIVLGAFTFAKEFAPRGHASSLAHAPAGDARTVPKSGTGAPSLRERRHVEHLPAVRERVADTGLRDRDGIERRLVLPGDRVLRPRRRGGVQPDVQAAGTAGLALVPVQRRADRHEARAEDRRGVELHVGAQVVRRRARDLAAVECRRAAEVHGRLQRVGRRVGGRQQHDRLCRGHGGEEDRREMWRIAVLVGAGTRLGMDSPARGAILWPRRRCGNGPEFGLRAGGGRSQWGPYCRASSAAASASPTRLSLSEISMLQTERWGVVLSFGIALVAAPGAPGQSWSAPFNHNEYYNGSDRYTHPYSPWHTLALNPSEAPAPNWTQQPLQPAQGFAPIGNVATNSGQAFHHDYTWPQPLEPGGPSFNAVHMSLIPKGPYRGHVLVWNNRPVVGLVNPGTVPPLPSVPAGQLLASQSYMAYAIIDPADVPLHGIRFRNFLMPMGDAMIQPSSLPVFAKNMFCAGHAWSPYGDLIVSGATEFVLVFPPAPQLPYIDYQGGILTYVFNPRLECYWPGVSPPVEYYPSPASAPPLAPPSPDDYFGMWVRADDLALRRWYPTVTVTHRIARGSPTTSNTERALVLAGVEEINPTIANDRAQVTYEAYAILGEAQPGLSGLVPDVANGYPLHLPSPVPPSYPPAPLATGRVFDGPGYDPVLQTFTVPLGEYPRTFLLSTGEAFVCGYEPRGSRLDHESPGTWLLTDAQPGAPGVYSSNWPLHRHDGSAVLFPNLGGNPDIVLRLGGADGFAGATTDTVETIDAGGGLATTWVSADPIPAEGASPPDGSRAFTNLVILPNSDLLLLGGRWQDGAGGDGKFLAPMLFSGGTWSKLPPNPVTSPRTYHSTAVLLPDGRVLLGGGDDRTWDYEIFSPPYLNAPIVRPENLAWQAPAPLNDPDYDADILEYDHSYEIHCDPLPAGHAVAKAVLTAPCSVTHHSDMHQRYVELETIVRKAHQVTFKLQFDERQAPRGLYMLWLVTNTGTPSIAKWVLLR